MKGAPCHQRTVHQTAFQRTKKYFRFSITTVAGALLPTYVVINFGSLTATVQAQSDTIQKQEQQLIRQFTPPSGPPPAPIYRPVPAPAPVPPSQSDPLPGPTSAPSPETNSASQPVAPTAATNKPAAPTLGSSQYILEFSRSPIVGNSLRLRGPYAEARLGFTRPRNWDVRSVKALIRYQHSPALFANSSNLTVRVNGTSVGSIPLNRKQSQIGELAVTIPPSVIQNYNELTIVVQQNNKDKGCADPEDSTLWTEVLPDSKVVFGFQPKAIPLDFSRYPYPFFDNLSLDTNSVTYLLPKSANSSWLTAAARLQAELGRQAGFQRLDTRLVKSLNQLQGRDHLIVIGTPEDQPGLRSLKLPYPIVNNRFVDGNKAVLPEDVGLLMLATTQNSEVPVLVITGNGNDGVAKATEFLLQPKQRQMGTGSAVLVDQIGDVASPPPRQWARHIPENNTFQLKDLKSPDNQAWKDVTVRGSSTPAIEFDFRALPDDQFLRGSAMKLYYSYGPQANPRLSTVEVRIDGTPIGGRRLSNENGVKRDSLDVNLPENLVKPNSKIQVAFNLLPRESSECGRAGDQQLWGTVHSDTGFNLNRQQSVQLPDLKLLQSGYPFTAPQDLSSTAIALPESPSESEVLTLLQVSERLGRLSEAETVKIKTYTGNEIPEDVRSQANLIGIGTRDRFPFPNVFQSNTFQLDKFFTRRTEQSQIQTLPDTGGVVKQIISPWSNKHVLLALTAQNNAGLDKIRELFKKDALFFQLKDDTALVNTVEANPSEYDPDAYTLSFFQEANRQSRIENISPLSQSSRLLRENWYLLPTSIILSALLLYGVTQLYLKQVASKGDLK